MKSHAQRISLIFDLDGTLFKVETVTVPAVKIAFQNLGLPPPSKNQILSGIGKVTGKFYEDLLPEGGTHLAQALQSMSSENEVLFLKKRKGRLYPGTKKVLFQLKKWNYSLGLISNSGSRYFREVIKAFDLAPLFDQSFCAGETEGLPKKDMVKEIVNLLGTKKGYVVGDRKEDIMAAKNNGLQSIGCLYGYGGTEELEKANLKIRDLRELISIFAP